MNDTIGTRCPECGLIHPIVPKGQCPIAKERRAKGTDKGKSVSDFLQKLSNLLYDSDNYQEIINNIKKVVNL